MKAGISKPIAQVFIVTLCSLIMFESCEEEEKEKVVPATISFEEELQSVTEGGEATIRLILDKPASSSTSIGVTIQTNAIYDRHYQTDPLTRSTGVTFLKINEGADAVSLKVRTIENSRYEGTLFIVLTITSFGVFDQGETTTHTLTIYDNEGPSVAFFKHNFLSMNEEDAEGIEILVPFSSPAKGEGSITISLKPGEAVEHMYFTSNRKITNNSLFFPVANGDTAVSFKLYPVDNEIFTGNFILQFSVSEVSGVIQDVNGTSTVTIIDDELPSIVQFAQLSASIDETNTTAQKIDLLLSSSVMGEGVLRIKFSSGSAVYGTDFTTIPAAEGDLITLELSHGQSSASFLVSAIDDEILTGNHTILFSIYDGTGPVWPGSHRQLHEFTIVENEVPSEVSFGVPSIEIDESDIGGINVALNLSAPALQEGKVIVQVHNYRDQFISDPPVEEYYSSFSYYDRIVIGVPKGAESVEFSIVPVNNSTCGDHSRIEFSISSFRGPLTWGQGYSLSLLMIDDEAQSTVSLKETEGILLENASTGKEVVLNFSTPAPAAGNIIVYLDYETNIYSGRFVTVPDFLQESSSGYPYGFLSYPANATSVSFEIVPVNDEVVNGDFEEIFYFSTNSNDPNCVAVKDKTFRLKYVDDD